jgi:hypothetical protein
LALSVLLAPIAYAQPGEPCTEPDEVHFTASADTIQVVHLNAMKNCCTELTVDVSSEDFVVDFVEGEAGEFCTCMCCFHHRYAAHGFEPGHYAVRVWFMDHLVAEGEVDVQGIAGGLAMSTVEKGRCLQLSGVDDGPPANRVTSWGRLRTHFR